MFTFPVVALSKLLSPNRLFLFSANLCFTFNSPSLELERLLLLELHLLPEANVQELDCICDKILLYFEVKRRVS